MSLNQGNNPENNGEKGDGRKPFRFNIYWLYALIAAVLIGFNLFKGITPSTVETSQTVFEDSMLLRGYVKQLQVIRNDGIVRVTLKPEAFNDPVIAKKFSKNAKLNKDKGPHFQFSIADVKSFSERVNKIVDEHAAVTGKPAIDYKEDPNWIGPLVSLLLPLSLIHI